MFTKDFLIEISLQRYIMHQTEVISGSLFTFITHKLQQHLVRVFTVSYDFQTVFTIMMS